MSETTLKIWGSQHNVNLEVNRLKLRKNHDEN